MYECRFNHLLPLLPNLTAHSGPSSGPDTVKDNIKALQHRVSLLSNSAASSSSMDIRGQVTNLATQVMLLQQRILGDGVQIGSKIFQSFSDLCAWVPFISLHANMAYLLMPCPCWSFSLASGTLRQKKCSPPFTVNNGLDLFPCMKRGWWLRSEISSQWFPL